MNEISFYEEFSQKFSKYLGTYLEGTCKIFYACNNTLDVLISRLEIASGFVIKPTNVYVPKLKLDIVFAICEEKKTPKLILIEAKYLNQLALKDYSQLVGYLQVAKNIDIGLLLLIQKIGSINMMSNDLQDIMSLKKLPMKWYIELETVPEKHKFQTGIIRYMPNGSIDWLDTNDVNGISSFEDLRDLLLS